MHYLFGDRYLRSFVDDLRRRQKQTKSDEEDQKTKASTAGKAEPDEPAFEKKYGKNYAEETELRDEPENNQIVDTKQ